jgi:hypothetical protein
MAKIRTQRLQDLLEKVQVNWREDLPGSIPWELFHVTIGEKINCLILGMGESGYGVYVRDPFPDKETVEEEVKRLSAAK